MQAGRKFSHLYSANVRPLPRRRPALAFAPAHSSLIKLYRLSDVAIAVAALLGAFLITNLHALPSDAAGFLALRVTVKNLLLLALFAALWSGIFRAFNLYDGRRLNYAAALRCVAACTCGSFFALMFPLTSRAGNFRVGAVVLMWAAAAPLTILVRLVLDALARQATAGKHPRHVLIVGSGERALRLYREMSAKAGGDYQLLGFVDSNLHPVSEDVRARMLGDLTQLETILVNHVVDEVLITLPVKSCYTQIQNTIRTCERIGVESKYLSEIFQPGLARAGQEQLEGFAVTSMKLVQEDGLFLVKRAIDIVGATVGLAVLSPLMVLIAVCVRLSSEGPVIFSQERYGRNKRRFRMYKFRTMVSNAEALQPGLEHRNEVRGPAFKIKNDPRITRLGKFLRRTSLDELPQLFNVLSGEMSLVGPRPLPQRDVSRFEEGWLMRRFCVVPGITCLWQINGRSDVSFDKWVELDLKYIENWSLMLDVKILLRTIPAVFKGAGAA